MTTYSVEATATPTAATPTAARRRSRSRALARAVRRLPAAAGMVLLAVLFGFPLLWMMLSAFKTTASVVTDAYPLTWRSVVPSSPTLSNFGRLFGDLGFGRTLWNTAVASAGQIAGSLVVCTLAGYAFARIRFRFRTALFALCMAGAFVPIEATVVPLYSVTKDLGLLSTYPVLFLPFICNPFGVFLMRQSFRDIPDELFDAAAVDGASGARTFWRVALPNVRPALATLALIQFIWSWSNYFWPLVSMQDPKRQVAQVAMAALQTDANNQPMYGEMFAAATVITVPLVLLSIGLQRYYVRGMLTAGLK
ncbi:carbohydrate ABC transporter permease [Dactylosporangium sp. CA-092794]|uniref:carbohydrate ABC transporter permease n=1 Tax=Dactylosporangium sp. CA-092794 TaxID=3239929 RepID=UPI003D8B7867